MSSRGNPSIGHGMAPSEARVMALWDSGLSNADIAVQLGLSEANVAKLTKYYDDAEDGRTARAAAMANIQFIDRMRAIYPWRFGTATLDEPGAGEGLCA